MVAIGNFDGVHQGHQAVLAAAAARAHAAGLTPLVLTFDPHPAEVLASATLDRLTPTARKAALIQRLSPELTVVVEPFTRELAAHTPEAFAREFLRERLAAAQVLVGENFRFGRGRAGDLSTLRELGAELGFQPWSEPLTGDAAGAISSSRAREAVRAGDLELAARLLTRPHALTGQVVHGDARGRQIGFPTANLAEVAELIPPHGVYTCLVDDLSRGEEPGRALATGVVNIGRRPTVDARAEAPVSVEAHLLTGADGQPFQAELYGARLRLHLVHRLREERRFDGLPALVAQIGRDAEAARERLAERRWPEPGAAWV
ncbi:MAG: riboflavin biosynthesis protein RibF [Polyangiaceae bacterium]|nr:riboflavin biosynthesis protein RibF [Polyangiaceae bacterium]MCW5790482.1 riboflavin biosynthesis protein RibF [Polyangiaceae bacterium]